MVLSIGMIVKNEEKYLERCLTALKPILENVDSELIIADTGSTDNTVEIAKKFTDKVYFFEWINDFSAARNYTMDKSQGDWFMFIDADEIIQDCSDIIHFFKSGEYLKYGTASYVVRSYSEVSDMESYSDFRALRLTKRFEDVAFVNPVHEALSPAYGPIKYLDMIADHYGYVFRDKGAATEQAREKSKRNLELLLKQLDDLEEGQVPEFSVYREIADCYQIIDEPDKALEYVNMGLELLDHKNIAINAYYCQKAILMVNARRFKDSIDVCNEYFSKKNRARKGELATDITMHVIRGDSYFRLRNYEKCIEDMSAFFDKYKKYVNNRLNTEDLLYAALKLSKNNIKTAFEVFFVSCNKTNKFNTALEYIKAFPIEDFQRDSDYIFKHLCVRVMLMENTSYDSIPSLYNQLDDHNKKQFIRILRWNVFKSKKPEELLKNLSAIADNDPKLSAVLDIYNDFFINNHADSRKIEPFLSEYGTDNNVDILCIMMCMDMDITPFVNSPDFKAAKCIHNFFEDYTDYLTLFVTYDITKISSQGLAKTAGVYGRAMVESQQQHRDIAKLFRIYGKIGVRWLSEYGTAENAPADIRAAIIADSITSSQDRKDYKLCINEMRRLIKDFPEFAPIVKEYQEVVKKEAQPVRNERSQLAEMAAAVKENVRKMIGSGNYLSAFNTLAELEKLCPGDPEIDMLREEIENKVT